MVDRVERITELLMMLLDAEHPLTFEEILARSAIYGERSEATRKSFERDKALLRSLGVEIHTTIEPSNGSTRYRVRPEDYFLPDLGLNEAEQLSLQLAASAIRLDEAWDDQAMAKLGATTSAPPMVVAELPSLGQLPIIHSAIRARAPLSFVYAGKQRELDGYGVFYRDGNWYLNGNDGVAAKTFRIDRIDGQVRVGESASYDLPESFDSIEIMPLDPLLIGEGDATVARVWIDQHAAGRVARLRGEEAIVQRNADGSAIFSVPVRNRPAFRSWLLGLRDHAEVLEPADIRADTIRWLSAIAEPV